MINQFNSQLQVLYEVSNFGEQQWQFSRTEILSIDINYNELHDTGRIFSASLPRLYNAGIHGKFCGYRFFLSGHAF